MQFDAPTPTFSDLGHERKQTENDQVGAAREAQCIKKTSDEKKRTESE